MRALVTGIAGFAGRHLTRHLVERGDEVWGFDLADPRETDFGLGAGALDPERLARLDLADRAGMEALVAKARPEAVFHLAGMAFVPDSLADPLRAWETNLLGGVRLLEAVRAARPEARVLLVTSGEVYGRAVVDRDPVDETAPFEPVSPYAASKAALDVAGAEMARSGRLDVVIARPFQHAGPGQAPTFVCSEFARSIARAEAGVAEPSLAVGNLDVERDFSDVRDVVRAYAALVDRGRSGEAYNVASGRAIPIREILETLRGLASVDVDVRTDPEKVRPTEVRRVRVSIDKISEDTGWEPRIPMDETLAAVLDGWRGAIAEASR